MWCCRLRCRCGCCERQHLLQQSDFRHMVGLLHFRSTSSRGTWQAVEARLDFGFLVLCCHHSSDHAHSMPLAHSPLPQACAGCPTEGHGLLANEVILSRLPTTPILNRDGAKLEEMVGQGDDRIVQEKAAPAVCNNQTSCLNHGNRGKEEHEKQNSDANPDDAPWHRNR